MVFENAYDDTARAASYADLAFPGTYWLAFRDLPGLLGAPSAGARALDFGCGAGRSTRFLRMLGFDVVGVDCSEAMLAQARAKDPTGTYLCMARGDLSGLPEAGYDRILAAFPFDNIPNGSSKFDLIVQLSRLVRPGGWILNLVSSEDLYRHEWVSFSTKDFPGNLQATSGTAVFTVLKDIADARPVQDIFCPESEYRQMYQEAGIRYAGCHRPMGQAGDPFPWINEMDISPWRIDILEMN